MPEPNDKKKVDTHSQEAEQPVINCAVLRTPRKDFIHKLRVGLKEFCEKLIGSRISDGKSPSLHYHSLSPINDADKDNAYFNALKWALDNRKDADIKNIALTGPYGSGKSSVLKTFQQKNKDRSLHFLNISLATFKEEIEVTEVGDAGKSDTLISDVDKNDTLRLIELSILQQIFYHEKDEKIPDSRFAKIKSLSKAKTTVLTILLLIATLSVLNILYPDFLIELLWYPLFSINLVAGLRYFSLLIAFGTLAYLCYKSIRFFRSIQISKLNFSHAEIQIGGDLSKSVLNQNLEEILYFFEVTSYNVVLIEDLDRFKQTEVFTKLRELNLLINGSKKSSKQVVFIYAVRDDMFQDKDRIKFFDFIIPVIPPINSSNSNEILSVKLKDFSISVELIEDIGLFVDDMRLLHNIVNEYYVYHQKLDKTLKQNNLLAIIVYKNIYPNDFVSLSQGKGTLYSEISKKGKYIIDKIQDIKSKIDSLTNEIRILEALKIKDVNELRSLYVLQSLNSLPNIISFKINNVDYKCSDVVRNDLFEYFKKDEVKYNYHFSQQTRTQWGQMQQFATGTADMPVKFSEVEKQVSINFSYNEREQQIIAWNEQKAEVMKRQVESCEKDIIKCQSARLKDLLMQESVKDKKTGALGSSLINLLLRKGYIDEDYLDYISIFHEGSLTKDDNVFLINVKTQASSLFDAKLNHIENLLKKIQVDYFETPYIFNFSILDFIIDNDQYQAQCKSWFEQLATEKEIAINFINRYVDRGIKIEIFIRKLCSIWRNIWGFIDNQTTYTEEKKRKFFKLILDNATLDDLTNIADISDLKNTIKNTPDFLSLLNSKDRAMEIIRSFDIRFTSLNFETSENTLFDFVYKGNYYELNIHMLQYILRGLNTFDQVAFDTQNFTAITNAKATELLSFIKGNINTYLTEVYLKIESNVQEDEQRFHELLKDDKVSPENLLLLIDKVATKITIPESSMNTINEILFAKSKIKPSWDAVIAHYVNNENKFTGGLNTFLNNKLNIDEIVKVSYPPNNIRDELKAAFSLDLLLNNALNNSVYEILIEAVLKNGVECNFSSLDIGKVKILLSKNRILLSVGNYNLLKSGFPDLQLQLLQNQHDEYMNSVGNYDLSEDNMQALLQNIKFTGQDKIKVLTSKGPDFLINSLPLLTILGALVTDNEGLEVGKDLIKPVLIKVPSTASQKVKLLNSKKAMFDNSEIVEIVNSIQPSLLPNTGPIMVENNNINQDLVTILKERGLIESWKTTKKDLEIFPVKPLEHEADISEPPVVN